MAVNIIGKKNHKEKQGNFSFCKASNFFALLFLCSLCLLSGCAMFKHEVPEKPLKQISFENHKTQINKIKAWTMNGKIAFSDGKNAANASISWNNSYNNFKIRIYGPFGSNAVIIRKLAENKYELISSEGGVLKANSAEKLMLEKLGWHVPVSGLTSWIKGVPVKYFAYKYKLNKDNQIVHLKQNNWEIFYDNYSRVRYLFLPKKMLFLNKNIKIKFVIKKWTFK